MFDPSRKRGPLIMHILQNYLCCCFTIYFFVVGNAIASEPVAVDISSDDFFSLDRIIAVEIEIAEIDWDELRHQSRTLFDVLAGDCLATPAPDIFSWFSANVSVDGETYQNVGIRKKGFLG